MARLKYLYLCYVQGPPRICQKSFTWLCLLLILSWWRCHSILSSTTTLLPPNPHHTILPSPIILASSLWMHAFHWVALQSFPSITCAAMRAISPSILFSFSVLSTTYFVLSLALIPWGAEAVGKPQVTVMGMVYCDICSNNTFSYHSYFLPGVQVKIECTFKASSPKTTQEISFDVTRSTNRYGIYQLQIPSMDGVECATEGNRCRATLTGSSTLACNVPGSSNTSNEIAVKSKQENTCIYSLDALNYRPSRRNTAFCGP